MALPGNVGRREHAHHARCRRGPAGVHGEHPGPRVVRKAQGAVQHARHAQVVHERPPPHGPFVCPVAGRRSPHAGTVFKMRFLFPAQHGGGFQHGVHDLDVAGAAAQVGAHRTDHLLPGGLRGLLQQQFGAHEKARRAESALHGARGRVGSSQDAA